MNISHKYKRRQRSQASEKELAKKVGGRVKPLSGALPIAKLKGDVESPEFLIDDKTTQGNSFNVSQPLLLKTRDDAFHVRKRPVVCVHFENTRKRFFILGEKEFIEYMQLIKMHNES